MFEQDVTLVIGLDRNLRMLIDRAELLRGRERPCSGVASAAAWG